MARRELWLRDVLGRSRRARRDANRHGLLAGASSTILAVIRLRQSLEKGLRHPLFGPLLLLFFALILAFVFLHTIEHGVEGLLFSCVLLVATSLRLVVVLGRTWRAAAEQLPLFGRAPPRRFLRLLPPNRVPPVPLALPLRL